MPRRLVALAIAALAVSLHLHGQTLPGSPARPTAPVTGYPVAARPGAVLIGQVVDAANGRVVPRAIVRLSSRGNTVTRVTDERGRFYFVDVPESDVEIVASKAGFYDGAYGKRRAGGGGIPLAVWSGRWVTDLRLELFKSAAISGIVSDEVNEPLPGIRVRAWRREYTEGRQQLIPAGDARTNDEGEYRIFDLKPGDYIISVPSVQVTLPLEAVDSAMTAARPPSDVLALLSVSGALSAQDRVVQSDGKNVLAAGRAPITPDPDNGVTFAYRTEFYPGYEQPLQAIPVVVGPSEDRRGIHFQLRLVPTHSVSGIVVGPNGPVPRQLVRLVLEGVDDQGLGNEAAAGYTGSDGTFTLLNVPEGRYTLQARGLGSLAGAPAAAATADDATSAPASAPKPVGEIDVAVTNTNVEGVILSVRPPPALRGRVVLENGGAKKTPDLTRIDIALLPASRTIGAALIRRPDASGAFAFPEIAAEQYFVRIGSIPAGWALKSVTGAGRDLLDAPIALEDDVDVTITLTDRGTQIWGTARDAQGAPAVGATVLVLPPASSGLNGLNPNRLREARASTSGIYAINGLPPGDYFVVAIDDSQAEGWQDPARADALRSQATRVTLRDAEQKLVDLRITKR